MSVLFEGYDAREFTLYTARNAAGSEPYGDVAIRIVHNPTGLSGFSQGKSILLNRLAAWKKLKEELELAGITPHKWGKYG